MFRFLNLPPPIEKEVNFYDWDGTILYSYTKEEALALTEMPTPPNRTNQNLVNEGWNYTLAEMQAVCQPYNNWVGVGCTYHTADNKTHITAEPDDVSPTIWLYVKGSVANDTVIDWGTAIALLLKQQKQHN